MEDINYRHQRQLDKSLMRSLSSCDWAKQHHNITISGASGLGKTYLCCALLEQACRKGYTAYYASAPKFFRQLAIGYADGSFDRILSKLARVDVLGIDDWGLTPLSEMERRHLLEVMDDRGGSRSTVLTSQFPVDNWHDLIGSPTLADAVMERILSNSYRLVLSGDTMRPVKKALQSTGKEGA
jgi:DNA replication protein DnaC